MSKELIASDIDDVVALNAQGFIEFSNREFGTSLRPEDHNENWAEMWQVDINEVSRRAKIFNEQEIVSTYLPIKESLLALNSLKERYRIIAVTSRNSNLENCTRSWLNTYLPDVFEDIYFAGIYDGPLHGEAYSRTKAEVFSRLDISYVIDDQLKHCRAAAELGIPAVLFGDYSWNKETDLPEGITRCQDWGEVLEYFDVCKV